MANDRYVGRHVVAVALQCSYGRYRHAVVRRKRLRWGRSSSIRDSAAAASSVKLFDDAPP